MEADELRTLLALSGRSQKWLAGQLGVNINTVARWVSSSGAWPIPGARHDRIRSLLVPDAETERLRLAIRRIFRDRRQPDKVIAECLAVMPELTHSARGGVSVSYETKGKNA
jgi:hypothetical protein